MTNTSTHPDKCIGNVTLDLKRLYQSMPKHLQKKVSLHDLKLICDAYNGDQPPVDNQYVADGCEKFGHWPEENKCTCGAESWENFSHFHDGTCILATAPEEPVSEWRELGPLEVSEKGDQIKFQKNWVNIPSNMVGVMVGGIGFKCRTRRPLPKQEEMPLDVIEKHANSPLAQWSNLECLRYLRDEIQKLKATVNKTTPNF
jgi:hypothetical protein